MTAAPLPARKPAAGPIITLLTDFGGRDHFVASMKGVILSIHLEARIVDLSHQIDAHQIEEAGYVLHSCYRSFPDGTIHVCVVDPGVGSPRRPLLVATSRCYFLAPDNGLLSRVLRDERGVEIRQIENERYRLRSEGATFDGRDLFAPAAAWLAKGEPIPSFGKAIHDPVTHSIPDPIWQGPVLVGQIDYVDRFGNLISNISARHIQEFQTVAQHRQPSSHIGPFVIKGVVSSYSEGKRDTPSALINSGGKLEIFLDKGNAAQHMRVGVGEEIRLC